MKCDECGQEHERLYLSCDSKQCEKRFRTRVYIVREHGKIIAICCHCDTVLAYWPDANDYDLDWTDLKVKPN